VLVLRAGLYSNCHNVNANATAVGGIYGYSHTSGGYDGGQSEFVRVPFADVGPALIPDWMDDEDAVLLTDALATGYFGAQLGDIVEGDVVVVFGAGPVGLYAAKSAWLMGAGRVIVIDHLEYRLAKARTFAHAETYNFTEHDDIVVLLKKLTDHLGADVAIDAVGRGGRRQLPAARQRGEAEAAGRLAGRAELGDRLGAQGRHRLGGGRLRPLFSAVKFGDAVNKGLTLRMNQCPVKRQWPRLFEHIATATSSPATSSPTGSRSSTSPRGTTCSRQARRLHQAAHRPERRLGKGHTMASTPPVPPPAAYTPQPRPQRETPDQLRARIPGWGVDLDPADRPSVPRLQRHEDLTGARWDFPERQPETFRRERSVEHAFVTPVFGTSCPPKGLSGLMRRLAYRRYSEAQAAHWLLLLAADRVDVLESNVGSLLSRHPDNPVAETGVKAELTHGGLTSRLGENRADVKHQPLDPVIVAAPWVLGAGAAYLGARTLVRSLRADPAAQQRCRGEGEHGQPQREGRAGRGERPGRGPGRHAGRRRGRAGHRERGCARRRTGRRGTRPRRGLRRRTERLRAAAGEPRQHVERRLDRGGRRAVVRPTGALELPAAGREPHVLGRRALRDHGRDEHVRAEHPLVADRPRLGRVGGTPATSAA
jgi:threonine dehydrogenase-like Zn-dependent dehydrogenase